MAATALGKTLFLSQLVLVLKALVLRPLETGPVLSVPGRAAAVRAGRSKKEDAFHGVSVDINH